MRTTLLILIATLLLGNVSLVAQTYESNNKESIQIVREEQLTPEIERCVFVVVYATLDRESYLVELEYYGLGDADVYILDSENCIVSQELLAPSKTITRIPLPDNAGHYALIIRAEHYSGIGYFNL